MNEKKLPDDIKKFIEYFRDVDELVKAFEEGKLSTTEIFKDIPMTVEAMLLSAFLIDEFYKVLADRAAKEDVEKVRAAVQKLEKFGIRIMRESRAIVASRAADKKEAKIEAEITDTFIKPFFDFSTKRNQIRLGLFSDEDKITDTTMSLDKCLDINADLLNGVHKAFELAAEFNSNLLPKNDDLKPYKKQLERIVNFGNKIASRLKIELETPKQQERTEKPT